MKDIKSVLNINAGIAEKILEGYLSEIKIGIGTLQDAMRYSTLGGGKRIRASLTIEFCKGFIGDGTPAYPFAAAIEMIHAYSLIHDDLPCMDDDDIRRGNPSCHAAFGEATALLAGDALLTYAFEVASSAPDVTPSGIIHAINSVSSCAGPSGMVGGQMTDCENSARTYEELKTLHSKKTSALIKASCLCGYYSSLATDPDSNIVSCIEEYAECLGLAFQIRDDILDLKGDAASLGKRTGVDKSNGRVSSLNFLSVSDAESECERLADRAAYAVKQVCSSEFLSELPIYLNSRMK